MTYNFQESIYAAQRDNNNHVFLGTHDVANVPNELPAFEFVKVVHTTTDADASNAGLAATPHNVFTVNLTLPNGVTVTVSADGTVRTSAVSKETGEGTDRWYDVEGSGALTYTRGESWTHHDGDGY